MSNTTERVEGFTLQKKATGKWYSRRTGDFTELYAGAASVVSKHLTARLLLNHADGTLTVTPVDGKPLVR